MSQKFTLFERAEKVQMGIETWSTNRQMTLKFQTLEINLLKTIKKTWNNQNSSTSFSSQQRKSKIWRIKSTHSRKKMKNLKSNSKEK